MIAGSEIAYSIAIFACHHISVYQPEENTDIPFESYAFRLNIYVVCISWVFFFILFIVLS